MAPLILAGVELFAAFVLAVQSFQISTTACAAIPSPEPVKPRPSSVVAFRLTCSGDTPIALASRSRICGIWGASLGR